MKYSIIIPHFNRPEIIMNTIKSFKDLKNKEIIIVDDVSTNENIQKLKSNINNLENHIKQDIKLILSEKKTLPSRST